MLRNFYQKYRLNTNTYLFPKWQWSNIIGMRTRTKRMGETTKQIRTIKILEGRANELEETDSAMQRNLSACRKGVSNMKKGGLPLSEGVFLKDRLTALISILRWMCSCCDTLGRCLASLCLTLLFNGGTSSTDFTGFKELIYAECIHKLAIAVITTEKAQKMEVLSTSKDNGAKWDWREKAELNYA